MPPKQRKIAIVGSRSVGTSCPIVDPLHVAASLQSSASFPSPSPFSPSPRVEKRLTHIGLCERAGKSSLTVQFVDGHFVESYYPTIENTFSKTIRFKNQDYATEIIDTAGQVSMRVFLLRDYEAQLQNNN